MRNDNEAQPTERQRRPTIADVATHAEVSRAAVSKVLRNAYGVSPQMRRR
ncbi:MAG TPA: LacI family DNA-binding transcriptional regulator [Candidatus Avipropionibacterium avicola]|uniref:LacI family DNA-binding transcriptional regulator n=1 Tax=Candidatus Avipropionibacterium avicola TaxID=2840701 RepID=A0A9D1H009_9ACTN|nr:LacI family DNA-binding transcriptional regulator [Candidatus Avipropionibacterium avicola]